MNIKFFLLITLFSIFFVCACDGGERHKKSIVSKADPRHQCAPQYNAQDAYCEVSVYELVAMPNRFDGMYVTFVAYVPDVRSKIVFFTRDAAEYEDYQSSFFIGADDRERFIKTGYARIFARFKHDRSDKNIAVGYGRQLGLLVDVESVKYIRSMSERKRECDVQGCVVDYL